MIDYLKTEIYLTAITSIFDMYLKWRNLNKIRNNELPSEKII